MKRPAHQPRSRRACARATLCAVVVLLLTTSPAHADDSLRFTATLDGRPTSAIDANRPLKLGSDRPLDVEVVVTNEGTEDRTVRSVRFESKVIGLTFFAYETRLDLKVPRGATEQRQFPLELLDLSDQATGLLPARITLLDENREVLASQRLAADVDGSTLSIYGVFAMLVFAITAVLVAAIIVRLAARRLSSNRWKRATRFGTAGLGIGLTLTFSLSAARLLLPEASRWLPLVLVCGALLFAVGYLTPTPYQEHGDDEDDPETLVPTSPGAPA